MKKLSISILAAMICVSASAESIVTPPAADSRSAAPAASPAASPAGSTGTKSAPCMINAKSDAMIANMVRSFGQTEQRIKELEKPVATDAKEIRLQKLAEAKKTKLSYCEGLRSMLALIGNQETLADDQRTCAKEVIADYKFQLSSHKAKAQDAAERNKCSELKPDNFASMQKELAAGYTAVKVYQAEWDKNPKTLEEAGYVKSNPAYDVRYNPGAGLDFFITVRDGETVLNIDDQKRVTGNR